VASGSMGTSVEKESPKSFQHGLASYWDLCP
jgi:hypothetical protein